MLEPVLEDFRVRECTRGFLGKDTLDEIGDIHLVAVMTADVCSICFLLRYAPLAETGDMHFVDTLPMTDGL